MAVLKALGIDNTLWIHLACFLVSYAAITMLIIKPYLAALHEREKRTVGGEETATRLIEEATAIHTQYEQKARHINDEIKSVYDQSRMLANKESDRLLTEARENSDAILEQARAEIGREVQGARKILSSEIPAVSSAIASKLAGKEISL
jgi:F-type H+-transporting ATPase subunit b